MNYKRLAELIRYFNDIDLLASEIESLEDDDQVETIDDLADFLDSELNYGVQ